MSKTIAPLLSLGASGQIAKTMVASRWKGINYMRRYVIPANPRTTGQQDQRAAVTASVKAWRYYITAAVIRTAWGVRASVQAGAMSAFNAAVSSLAKILKADPDASYATAVAEASQAATFTMKNMDDGAAGDEAGSFEVWVGTTPSNGMKKEEKEIADGTIVTSDLGDEDHILYVELRKGGQSRSGICKLTLTA